MLRHPWARRVLEERGTTGPAVLAYIESILAILRDGGFSLDLAHHTLHVLGSRIFGFTQDLFEDSSDGPSTEVGRDRHGRHGGDATRASPSWRRRSATRASSARCDDDVEFAFGLDLILDGLARRISAKPGHS